MRKLIRLVITMVALGSIAIPSAASATTKPAKPAHPAYLLGRAKSCKANFHKTTVTLSRKEKVKGKTKVVKSKVVECIYRAPAKKKPSLAAPLKTTAPITGTTSGATSTPPAADPPTSVTVTSSENPAVINDAVIYTVTVASTAIPTTTGQLEVFDNGSPLQGCDPIPKPVYASNGTFVGTCTTSYNAPSSDVISAIFTGDQVFAQSAGSMTEVVNESTPVLAPVQTGSSGSSGGGTSAPASTPVVALAVAFDSPAYTQSNSNYLDLTYSATASSTSNGSPAATQAGTVTFYSDNVPTCTMAVGGSSGSTATCAVSLSQYGSHTINVSYSDGQGDTATTGVQSEMIEPPDITVNATWGTTAPTNGPTASINVIGSTASVAVSDSNFEGATSIGLADQLGDSCTATVGTTSATCSMSVTGTPTSLTVSFPGGTSTVGTQSVPPNGTQQVTTTWGAVSGVGISGGHLQVSVQQATVVWSNWAVQSGSSGTSNPPNPINTTVGKYVHLFNSVTGNVSPDGSLCNFGQQTANQEPCGYLVYTVTQTGGTATTWTEMNEDAGSSDCSEVQNFSLQAEGGCSIVINGLGTFQISAEYIANDPSDSDANYGNTSNAIVITVNVS